MHSAPDTLDLGGMVAGEMPASVKVSITRHAGSFGDAHDIAPFHARSHSALAVHSVVAPGIMFAERTIISRSFAGLKP